MKKVILLVPPFVTPFAPPLGVSLLKSYLQKQGHQVTCIDLNVGSELWDTHHEYFALLNQVDGKRLDGYSLYWNILNQHMLAAFNGISDEDCRKLLTTLTARYSVQNAQQIIPGLIELVKKYFESLEHLLVNYHQIKDYDVVGTSTYSTSLASSLFIHKIVKKHYPGILTVMGGGVFADDLAIGTENLETLLREYTFVDKIVIGEGEILFSMVLDGEFAGQRMVSLSDLNQQTMNINESMTPDFSDFDLSTYYHLTIEGSRSCPFQCKFCSERLQWGTYRKKDPAYLAQQLIQLNATHGKRTFFLGDSLINLYIEDLARELIARNAGIAFDGYLRAEPHVMNPENTRLWAKAGLYRVRLGLESASPHVLQLMNKKITPENIRACLKSLSSAGIRTTTYWVVGFPGETEQDFQQTLDFVRENHQYIYELEAHPYYYYPTGQAASSEHAHECIFPEEVINMVKFKKYDISQPVPSVEERYKRLRQIAQLSKEVGLYNIYSLFDLYAAEDRWLSMYPNAQVIYE